MPARPVLPLLITPLSRASMAAEPLSTLIVADCLAKLMGLSRVTMASALLAERVRTEPSPIWLV